MLISSQEVGNISGCFFQNLYTGQIYNTEMIRFLPVKAAAVDQKDFFLTEKIQGKFFIICDVEFFRINFRENIKCCLGFYCSDSRDVCKGFVNKFSLFINPSAGNNIIIYTLMSAKCSLYNRLSRYIGSQTHIG